jgi:ATP synthase protein I
MGEPKTTWELLKFSALGLEMGAAVVIGLLIGMGLDRWLDTGPWLTIVFILFGFGAAVKGLLRSVREIESADGEKPGGKPGGKA